MNLLVYQIYYTYCNLNLEFAYEMDKLHRNEHGQNQGRLLFWSDDTFEFVKKYNMEF